MLTHVLSAVLNFMHKVSELMNFTHMAICFVNRVKYVCLIICVNKIQNKNNAFVIAKLDTASCFQLAHLT